MQPCQKEEGGTVPDQYQAWGFRGEGGSTYSDDELQEEEGGGGEGTILNLDKLPRMEGAMSEDSASSPGNSFALMEFVKEQQRLIQELRQENVMLMSQCKDELRAQILDSLKEEAQGILEAFSTGVIQSVSQIPGQGGLPPPSISSKRAGKTPLEEVQERTVRKKRERRWLEQQVASGIEDSVRSALGTQQLLPSPGQDQVPQDPAAAPPIFPDSRPMTSTLRRRPTTVASSTIRISSTSRRTSASRGASRMERDKQRIDRYLADSPLQPIISQGPGRHRPWTGQALTRRPQSINNNTSGGPTTTGEGQTFEREQQQTEGGGEEYEEESEGNNNNNIDNKLDSRTATLLEASQRLLDDQSVQRARTAMGTSRAAGGGSSYEGYGGGRPGTSLASRRSAPLGRPYTCQETSTRGRGLPTSGSLVGSEPLQEGGTGVTPEYPSEPAATTTTKMSSPSRAHDPGITPTSTTRGTKLSRSRRGRPSTSAVTGRPSSQLHLKRSTTLRNVGDLLPRKLGEDEWENEVARNILTLYASTVTTEVRRRSFGKDFSVSNLLAEDKGTQSAALITATSTMAESVTQSLTQHRADTDTTIGGSATTLTNVAPTLRPSTATPTPVSPPRPSTSCPRIIKSLGHSKLEIPRRVGTTSGFILIPRIPPTIWFSGTGTNHAEWSAVPGMNANLLRELQGLDEKGDFAKYLAILEALLVACLRAEGDGYVSRFLQALWKQLVVVTNNFAVRCIEMKRYPLALELLSKALALCEQDNLLDERTTHELTAYIYDTYSLYYHRRGKQNAALLYVQRAMKIHSRHESWAHVAACHLHSAVILAKLSRVAEGVRCMGQVLHLVETAKLEVGGQATQKIALVAVCYHNLAVLYLSLRNLGEAFMCSQNGRRLARLSLSYTNRWIDQFERTHKVVLCELAAKFKYIERVFQSNEQAYMFGALLTAVH